MIVIPRRHRCINKPPHIGEINHSNYFSNKFGAFYLFNSRAPRDLIGQGGNLAISTSFSDGGSVDIVNDSAVVTGPDADSSDASKFTADEANGTGGFWHDALTKCTIFFDCDLTAEEGGPKELFSLGGGYNGISIAHRTSPDTISAFICIGGVVTEVASQTTFPASDDRIYLIATFGNGLVSLFSRYKNKIIKEGSSSLSSTIISHNSLPGFFGVNSDSPTITANEYVDGWSGHGYSLGISVDYAFSDDEALDFLRNPYQILKSNHRKIFIPSSAGGITLTISDSIHSLSSDNLSLTQNNILAVSESLHSVASDNIDLVQQNTLSIDESTNSLASDNITLSQDAQLSVNESSHNVISDNLTLSASGSLNVNDALHTITSDNVSLTQQNTLSINETVHSVISEAPSLVQQNQLTINESFHTITSNNIELDISNILTVNASSHSVTSDNIALIQANVLSIDEVLHSVVSDNIDLTQANILTVNDSGHLLSSDNIDLDFSVILSVNNSNHTVDSEQLSLVQNYLLAVNDSLHGVSSYNLDLTQDNVLLINDSLHQILSDNVHLIDDLEQNSVNFNTIFVLSNKTNLLVNSDKKTVYVMSSKNNLLV